MHSERLREAAVLIRDEMAHKVAEMVKAGKVEEAAEYLRRSAWDHLNEFCGE